MKVQQQEMTELTTLSLSFAQYMYDHLLCGDIISWLSHVLVVLVEYGF